MTAPQEKQVINVLKEVQSLSAEVLDGLVSKELGTPLLGAFDALARATGPDDDKATRTRKVHLMVMAYLMSARLRGSLDF